MTFYELQEQFWQMEDEQQWSSAQVKLYFWWLNQFNIARWPASISRKLKQVAAAISMDEKTVDAAKNVLVARGLLSYTPGASGRSAIWGLSYSRPDSPEADRNSSAPLRPVSPEPDRNFSGQVQPDSADSPKADRKNSGPIRNKKKNSSGVEEDEEDTDTARGVAKKNEEGALVQFNLPSDEPNASASHTRGGGLAELAEGEQLRGGFIDHRLNDSDPRKWEDRPRDAQMVNDYLAGHPDENVHKHAGKGEIFIEYYDLVGWMVGSKPMRNWRIAAKNFKYLLPNGPATTSKPSTKPDERYTAPAKGGFRSGKLGSKPTS